MVISSAKCLCAFNFQVDNVFFSRILKLNCANLQTLKMHKHWISPKCEVLNALTFFSTGWGLMH